MFERSKRGQVEDGIAAVEGKLKQVKRQVEGEARRFPYKKTAVIGVATVGALGATAGLVLISIALFKKIRKDYPNLKADAKKAASDTKAKVKDLANQANNAAKDFTKQADKAGNKVDDVANQAKGKVDSTANQAKAAVQ